MVGRNYFFALIPAAAILAALVGVERQSAPVASMDAATAPNPPSQTPDGVGPPPLAAQAEPLSPTTRTTEVQVATGSTLSKSLQDLNFSATTREAILAVLNPELDVTRIAAGTVIKATFTPADAATPSRLEVTLSQTKTLVAEDQGQDSWKAQIQEAQVTTSVVSYSGVVVSNLWSSASVAGMDSQLVSRLAEIFSWQIDFNRALRFNDHWRLTVEQQFVDGKSIGYGNIIAAEYVNAGSSYTAVRYDQEGGDGQFYGPDGGSLRRMFLKSPLKFGHVTSGFSAARFHPILKIRRPHLGIDYGAPSGTPIMSVGDGTVTFAAAQGGSGNMVNIRHNSLYATNYKHLSRFAKGIVPGTKVTMGQIIGYVGSTGLATGPHLHFEFHQGNGVVDPAKLKFPTSDPVPAKDLAQFKAHAVDALAKLPPWGQSMLSLKAE